MDLTSPEVIKNILGEYGAKPAKERGQNFLISRETLNKIVETASLDKNDEILEIGPGLGVLTNELAGRVKRVVAVETDRKIAKALRKIMADQDNLEIVEDDILTSGISSLKLAEYKYKIVSNLPYQITSAIFKKFLGSGPRPAEMTVMVQKEVAERICAGAGEENILALSVQFFGHPEIAAIVPREFFWPEPAVDSAILKISQIKKISDNNKAKIEPEKFFRIVKIGFSARRKQLHNNLSAGLRISDEEAKKVISNTGFDPKARAQDLALDGWIKLALALESY